MVISWENAHKVFLCVSWFTWLLLEPCVWQLLLLLKKQFCKHVHNIFYLWILDTQPIHSNNIWHSWPWQISNRVGCGLFKTGSDYSDTVSTSESYQFQFLSAENISREWLLLPIKSIYIYIIYMYIYIYIYMNCIIIPVISDSVIRYSWGLL